MNLSHPTLDVSFARRLFVFKLLEFNLTRRHMPVWPLQVCLVYLSVLFLLRLCGCLVHKLYFTRDIYLYLVAYGVIELFYGLTQSTTYLPNEFVHSFWYRVYINRCKVSFFFTSCL